MSQSGDEARRRPRPRCESPVLTCRGEAVWCGGAGRITFQGCSESCAEEASPSPVYGARLLSGFGVYSPIEGSNPSASASESDEGPAGRDEVAPAGPSSLSLNGYGGFEEEARRPRAKRARVAPTESLRPFRQLNNSPGPPQERSERTSRRRRPSARSDSSAARPGATAPHPSVSHLSQRATRPRRGR